jgi:uncharacterized RDD family membrane protein YckC
MTAQQPPPEPPPPQPIVSWQAPPPQTGPAPGVEFAPHGARLLSYIIDVFIASVGLAVLIIVGVIVSGPRAIGDTTVEFANPGIFFLVVILGLLITLGYFPFFWARGGQTPGMRPFDLYVVRDSDGGRPTIGMALMRLVGYWINGIVLHIGFAWILIDNRRRGWHDIIAGTVVVKR